ncbi:MAG: J domain-containing protein [Lachnospiraceae bacterium]|nr:J domain-containing protein [Lachnospiraceae bacterium]
MNIWNILDIEPTTDKRAIRKAYAAKTKETHPEDAPEEFKRLHEAYQAALVYADYVRQVGQSGGSVTSFYIAAESTADDAGGDPVGNAGEDAAENTGESETARTEEITEEPGRENLRAYFKENQEKQFRCVDAFLKFWKAFECPYRNMRELERLREYLSSEEFRNIRYHPRVLQVLADEIDDKFYYGIDEVKMLFWEAYGFQEDEETAYQGDRQRLWGSLYPAFKKRQQTIRNEQRRAKRNKRICLLAGIAAAAAVVSCILAFADKHIQRGQERLNLIDYMERQYPGTTFSEPDLLGKEGFDGGNVYNLRSLDHPGLAVTATVEYRYVEGEKTCLVKEDYTRQLFGFYAAQYGLDAGTAPFTAETNALFYQDIEELDAFCGKVEKMFREQEELQVISEVAILAKPAMFSTILLYGGVSGFPFADNQIYDLRDMKAEELSAALREVYMLYMFQYESWNITVEQYREWGTAYEQICKKWENGDGEWHEVYDPDTGEHLCRIFLFTYCFYGGHYDTTIIYPVCPK